MARLDRAKQEDGMGIMVAVDNSEYSLKAVEKAIEMARLQGGEMTVISVALELPDIEEIPVSYGEKLKDQALRAVRKATEMAENAGIRVEARVEVGTSPAENIVNLAYELKTNLIVIGHRGITGIGRFLIGSVAGRVVAHAPCSVLVVK
ncbi:MAG: universal stress protein [Proteobacteria bacterium]|nr:universal stress protein [Pseudomonadota bacterium]